MKKFKGKITYTKEMNPNGSYNVLQIKSYSRPVAIAIDEENANKLIEIYNTTKPNNEEL